MTLLTELRAATRANKTEALARCLADHPELPFTDDAQLAAAYGAALAVVGNLEALHALALAHPFLAGKDPDTLAACDPETVADAALCLAALGQSDAARAALRTACARAPHLAIAQARRATLALLANDPDEAAQAFDQALLLWPDHPPLLINAAALDLRLGRYREAAARYARALALAPELELAHRNRLLALKALGETDEALAELQAAATPENVAAQQRLANAYLFLERYADAAATLLAALEHHPDAHELRAPLLHALLQQEAIHQAGTLAKEWLETITELPEGVARAIRLLLNEARIRNHFLDAAIADLEAMRAADPDDLDGAVRTLLARAYADAEKPEMAVPLLQAVLAELPGHVQAALQLVHTLTSLGRLAEANEWLDRLAALGLGEAILPQRIEANDFRATPEELDQLKARFDDPTASEAQRAAVGFTLYRALDKAQRYDEAFAVLTAANELEKRHLAYDWRAHRRFVEETLETFTPELIAALSQLPASDAAPIFVVGMPRSGTTLTEQILAAHSHCLGRGELPWIPRLTRLMPQVWGDERPYPAVLRALVAPQEVAPELAARRARGLLAAAHYYLTRANAGQSESKRLVDKLPHNFDYVGLIALLFPNAPIVQLVRNPMDNALSNYEQNYAAKHGLMGFAYDLTWIAEMLLDYDRLMAHWHACFPGRIFRLEYERLVNAPEETVRELLDFCRLPWEPQVLAYYENRTQVRTASIRQVRQGIYRSAQEKWRRYERQLQPVAERLALGFRTLAEAGESAPTALAPNAWAAVTF